MRAALERLRSHAGFRRYLANTSWMFAEQGLRLLAGLVVGIWVARYLGPRQFGVYSYAIAFVAIFAGLAKLGLDAIVVRELVRAPEKRDDYLGTAFWLKAAGGALALAVIAAASRRVEGDPVTVRYILIIACGALFQSFEVIDFYFQSQVLSRFVSLCKLTQLTISSLLKLGLVLAGARLEWFVLVALVDQLTLGLTLAIVYATRRQGGFYARFSPALARAMLRDSWPLLFSGMLMMIYMRIDQLMIKAMLGEAQVGLYSAAVRLGELWYFVPVILTNSLFPAVVSAKQAGETVYYARLQRLYTLMLWSALAIALPMTFLSDWLIVRLFGAPYAGAGATLRVLSWASVNVFVGSAWSSWILCENRQLVATAGHLAGALLNIALNLVLLPRYGILGAAWATLLSYTLSALFVYTLYKPGRSYGLLLGSLKLHEAFR